MAVTDKQLEATMVSYKNLRNIPVCENREPFVQIDNKIIGAEYMPELCDMREFLDGKIYVRSTVSKKLLIAQKKLQLSYPMYRLFVTYGYRSLSIQTANFQTELQKRVRDFYPDPEDLYEAVHRYIAVPIVAGHPTGGAIDIVIQNMKTKKFLDFGSKQYDFSNTKTYTFSPNISKQAKANRMLLRKTLMDAGFAPFDGEWWHFSYGDKEWDYYYKKTCAFYKQKNLREIIVSTRQRKFT